MARAFCTTMMLSLVTSLLIATLAGADPVAVIASVKGKVEVVPAGAREPQRAVFGRGLEAGDKISVSAGGAASLFFGDGNVVQLAEKSTMTIAAKDAGAAKGKASGVGGEVYASVSKFVTAATCAVTLPACTYCAVATPVTATVPETGVRRCV